MGFLGNWFARSSARSLTKNSKRIQLKKFTFSHFENLEDRCVLAAQVATNELLVQFSPWANDAFRQSVRSAVFASVQEQIHTPVMRSSGLGVLETLSLPASANIERAIQALKNRPGVESVDVNYRLSTQAVSNDPYYTTSSRLWGMYSSDSPTTAGPSGTTNIFGSQAEQAWNAGITGSSSIYVGIIDEGVDYTHPDLTNNMWVNTFEPIDGIDNDGNGYVDDARGWDFFNNDNSTFDAADGDDHGTHVAGTIGAKGGNGIGVAGVNWNVTMISTKFLGPSGGSTSGAIKALDYLTDLKNRHGINIVASSNSWGGGGYSTAMHSAILRAAKAGILFVAAAGNSTSDNDVTANYPSNYSTLVGTSTVSAASYEAVVAVAAISNTGGLASFSSYGATTVDIGAPGVSINSTVPGGGYASYSGTSMATPHVTGAVALYASANPTATPAQIRSALLNSATATSSLTGKTVTGGRLNVQGMLNIQPPVSVSIGNASLTEGNLGSSQMKFTVTLSAASIAPVSVNYTTANGSAAAGSDYVAQPLTTITFAAGELSKDIFVDILGDTTVETNETFSVNLSGLSGNAVLSAAQATGTIVNDDVAQTPVLTVSDASAVENAGVIQFVFTLSAPSTSTVTVNFATAFGTAKSKDFRNTSGTLTFAPGQTSKTISVTLTDDRLIEANETFFLRLSSPVGATIGRSQATGTILDNDGTAATLSYLNGLAAQVTNYDTELAAYYLAVDSFYQDLGKNNRRP